VQRLHELDTLFSDEKLDIWATDSRMASSYMEERGKLNTVINECESIETSVDEHLELWELANAEEDEEMMSEFCDELDRLNEEANTLGVTCLMDGKYDARGCFVELHTGAGGVDAQSWCEMLGSMYERWAERSGLLAEWIDRRYGEGAGLKAGTLRITGEYAYGLLHREAGVHRLVRISPFDTAGRRHTSFASVSIEPLIPNDSSEAVVLDMSEVKVDVMRSSGPGGQSVNTTDSCVRMTHLPTGLVAICQRERSQHRNRVVCAEILQSKLTARKTSEENDQQQAAHAGAVSIGFGSEEGYRRSYTLHPYALVKDARITTMESSNPDCFLDGEIDEFLKAAVLQQQE
jgi:peptide chain release factor 2